MVGPPEQRERGGHRTPGSGVLPCGRKGRGIPAGETLSPGLRLLKSVACISGPSTWTVGWAVMVLFMLVEYMCHLAPFSSKETWAQGEVMCPGHSMSVMACL